MISILRLICLCLFVTSVNAESLRVAVASNFAMTLKQLSKDFSKLSGHEVIMVPASTGKLYAQILHGAPYDVFLSADKKRADILVEKGLAYNATIYASGELVFVARQDNGLSCKSALDQVALSKVAIANPKTAPYGAASKEALRTLNKWDALKSRLVMGENVLQAFQFIVSGSAKMGFIARSLVLNTDYLDGYCRWQIPKTFYKPIEQQMVALTRSKKTKLMTAWYQYMSSAEAKKIITKNGYHLE